MMDSLPLTPVAFSSTPSPTSGMPPLALLGTEGFALGTESFAPGTEGFAAEGFLSGGVEQFFALVKELVDHSIADESAGGPELPGTVTAPQGLPVEAAAIPEADAATARASIVPKELLGTAAGAVPASAAPIDAEVQGIASSAWLNPTTRGNREPSKDEDRNSSDEIRPEASLVSLVSPAPVDSPPVVTLPAPESPEKLTETGEGNDGNLSSGSELSMGLARNVEHPSELRGEIRGGLLATMREPATGPVPAALVPAKREARDSQIRSGALASRDTKEASAKPPVAFTMRLWDANRVTGTEEAAATLERSSDSETTGGVGSSMSGVTSKAASEFDSMSSDEGELAVGRARERTLQLATLEPDARHLEDQHASAQDHPEGKNDEEAWGEQARAADPAPPSSKGAPSPEWMLAEWMLEPRTPAVEVPPTRIDPAAARPPVHASGRDQPVHEVRAPAEANPAPRTGPVEIRIDLPAESADATPVQLHVREHRGEIQLAVRTADSQLTRSLQEGLPELVERLEGQGYHQQPLGDAQRGRGDSGQGFTGQGFTGQGFTGQGPGEAPPDSARQGGQPGSGEERSSGSSSFSDETGSGRRRNETRWLEAWRRSFFS